jgi:Tol biopolymer transport system component
MNKGLLMKFSLKANLLPCLLVFALIISGCSIDIQQTGSMTSTPLVENPMATSPAEIQPMASLTSTPSNESLTATSTASLVSVTQIPVTWAPLNLTGKLVYTTSTREDDGTTISAIQILDLTTGNMTSLFSEKDAWVFYMAISPDFKWLAMSYSPAAQDNVSSNRALYSMPLDASSPPQLLITAPTPEDHYTQVEWSPDGKYLYYVHYNHNQSEGKTFEAYEIFRYAYPNGTPEQILSYAFWPRISADSSKIVYVSLDPESGNNELWLANADGSNPQQVIISGASIPVVIDAPILSPDGQSILFSAPSPGQAYQPSWFEKLLGIQIAEAHNVPSDWWSVPVTGGTPTQLTNIQTINLFASISPDKKHIASVGEGDIFVMDLDGSNLTRIISDPGIHGTVSWIP